MQTNKWICLKTRCVSCGFFSGFCGILVLGIMTWRPLCERKDKIGELLRAEVRRSPVLVPLRRQQVPGPCHSPWGGLCRSPWPSPSPIPCCRLSHLICEGGALSTSCLESLRSADKGCFAPQFWPCQLPFSGGSIT